LARAISDADLRTLLARIRQPVQQAVATMPSQADFIERYCKAPDGVWPRRLATA
jgi:tryptophan halogenase